MAASVTSSSNVNIVSYNMHGINQGGAMLMELCMSYDLIFCQEHWLSSDQLFKLNDMADGFCCI